MFKVKIYTKLYVFGVKKTVWISFFFFLFFPLGHVSWVTLCTRTLSLSLFVCMYVCVYVQIYTCTDAGMPVHEFVHECVYTRIYIHLPWYICIYPCIASAVFPPSSN